MTKIQSQKWNLFIVALLLGVLVFPHLVSAQSEALKDALKDVDEKVEKIEENQTTKTTEKITSPVNNASSTPTPTLFSNTEDVNLNNSDEVKASIEDLSNKKEALVSIIEYSLIEAEDLSEKSDKIFSLTKDLAIKNAATINIDFIQNRILYLEALQETLEKKDFDLTKVQIIASDLKSWRDEIYNPEVKNILDLSIVHQAELIIAKTNLRMKKVGQDVRKIEELFKNEPLTPFLIEATTKLDLAIEYFILARDEVVGATAKREEIFPREEATEEKLSEVKLFDEIALVIQASEAPEASKQLPTEEITSTEVEESKTIETPKTQDELILENNQTIEDAHESVQLHAEKISDKIRALYKTLFKMSATAKKILAQ